MDDNSEIPDVKFECTEALWPNEFGQEGDLSLADVKGYLQATNSCFTDEGNDSEAEAMENYDGSMDSVCDPSMDNSVQNSDSDASSDRNNTPTEKGKATKRKELVTQFCCNICGKSFTAYTYLNPFCTRGPGQGP